MTGNSAGSISRDDFESLLERYPDKVKAGLEDLDEFRYETLPAQISQRREEQKESKKKNADPLMWKDELVELVVWKLKHGTFRPKLKQLAESNDEDLVQKIMRDLSTSKASPQANVKMLTQLKGIGPATASLVLSCIWPSEYPFFSDELFRWIHWNGLNADGTNVGIKPGSGWTRPIGYKPDEYESLIAQCKSVQERLSGDDEQLSFLDLEKVAYVLGKEKTQIQDGASPDTESSLPAESEESEINQDKTSEKGRNKKKRSSPPAPEARPSKSKKAKK
jgi:hypothetical protein